MSGSYYDIRYPFYTGTPPSSWSENWGYETPNRISSFWTCLFCGCANANTEEGSGCCGQGKAWGCGAPKYESVKGR